jgi:hypothetical protein
MIWGEKTTTQQAIDIELFDVISGLVFIMGTGGLHTRKCLRWLRHRGSGVLSEAPCRTRRGGAGLVFGRKWG